MLTCQNCGCNYSRHYDALENEDIFPQLIDEMVDEKVYLYEKCEKELYDHIKDRLKYHIKNRLKYLLSLKDVPKKL